MKQMTAIAATAAAVLLAAGLHAQQPAPTAPAVSPDLLNGLSGIWNRLDTSGAGSYGAIDFPMPQLTPEYAAKIPTTNNYGGFGPPPPGFVPPTYDIRGQAAPQRCGIGGGPGTGAGGFDINSAGMSLMASKDLVLMLRDGAQGSRHIYTDGRPFPGQLTAPYSIGRFENGALVVTTRGFTGQVVGNDRPQNRGYRDTTTEVIETFRPSADGKRLVVTYTHNDPKVYVKPWVYDITFERLPPDQYAFESWCDSREWIAANQTPTTAAPRPATPPAAK
jgi:hypothetical protein